MKLLTALFMLGGVLHSLVIMTLDKNFGFILGFIVIVFVGYYSTELDWYLENETQ